MLKDAVKASFYRTTKKSWFKKFIFILIILAIGYGLGVYTVYSHYPKLNDPAAAPVVTIENSIPTENELITLTTRNVEEIVFPASDLTTTKYYYKDAASSENSKTLWGAKLPGTTNIAVFSYEGVIHLGIDLSDMTCAVNNEEKIISIKLPEVKLLAHEIDHSSFEFVYESDSIFNDTGMEDYTDTIEALKVDREKNIMDNRSLMEEVRRNTESLIRNLLSASELTKEYKVSFQ